MKKKYPTTRIDKAIDASAYCAPNRIEIICLLKIIIIKEIIIVTKVVIFSANL